LLFYLTSLFRYFPTKLKISVVCLLFLLILASFVETLSLGTIPVFVGLISNPEGVQDLLDQNNINIDITVISNEDLIVYGSLLLLVIFFFKNLYLFFLAFFNLKVTKAITVNLGVKLFSSYVRDSYSNHVQKNLSELTRNLTSEVTQTVSFITSFLKILRESFLFVFLILLLLAYNPMISVLVFSVIGGVSLAIILIIKGPLKRFSQKVFTQ
jgi:ABC-type bacteriocin/lantibiotic exporter with double-glycine peptidase domain